MLKVPPLSVIEFSFLPFPARLSLLLFFTLNGGWQRNGVRSDRHQLKGVVWGDSKWGGYTAPTATQPHTHEDEHKVSADKDRKNPQGEPFHSHRVLSLTLYTPVKGTECVENAKPWKRINTSRHIYLCEIKRLNLHYNKNCLSYLRHKHRVKEGWRNLSLLHSLLVGEGSNHC